MIKRIFHSIFFTAVLVFLAGSALVTWSLYSYFTQIACQELRTETRIVAQGAEAGGADYVRGLDGQNFRITWIDADGTVLFDNDVSADDLTNHLQRPEVQSALQTGYGESRRYSDTMTQEFFYSAKLLTNGTVIRLSLAQNTIASLIYGMLPHFLLLLLVTLLLSGFLAVRLAKKIVDPLNEIDLDNPIANESYDELAPLLERIDQQQERLSKQRADLRHKKRELATVLNRMNEGIAIFNNEGTVLAINRVARSILDADIGCIGKNRIVLTRNMDFQNLVSRAIQGTQGEKVLAFHQRLYQVNASTIRHEDNIHGAAALLFDVTEREKNNRMRREFTANVSHELKTPLHTISGYAELLQNHFVKTEDMPLFAHKIYVETQRMIQLVEDIINLSHLDEGAGSMQWQTVDLAQIARQVKDQLQPEAESAGITLRFTDGDACPIYGVSRLLQEIAYNLGNNAIKYNKPGGSVTISVRRTARKEIELSVTDTGIGIPKGEEERIFERFYRVDKSHSKEVGGTGLGLSIVKHAALLHHARIRVDSKLGVGTKIIVTFPGSTVKNSGTVTQRNV